MTKLSFQRIAKDHANAKTSAKAIENEGFVQGWTECFEKLAQVIKSA